jgi:hypothetical protein
MMLFLKFIFGVCFCMWLYITLTWIEGAIHVFKFVKSFLADKAFVIAEAPPVGNNKREIWGLVGAQTQFIYVAGTKEQCLEMYAKLDAIKKKHNL